MHVHLHGLINYELIIITISIVCIVYNMHVAIAQLYVSLC